MPILSRDAARNFWESMLSRGNDCKARLSAILPVETEKKRERESMCWRLKREREREIVCVCVCVRVDKRENEGEGKADNSTKLRTGRRQRQLRHAAN